MARLPVDLATLRRWHSQADAAVRQLEIAERDAVRELERVRHSLAAARGNLTQRRAELEQAEAEKVQLVEERRTKLRGVVGKVDEAIRTVDQEGSSNP